MLLQRCRAGALLSSASLCACLCIWPTHCCCYCCFLPNHVPALDPPHGRVDTAKANKALNKELRLIAQRCIDAAAAGDCETLTAQLPGISNPAFKVRRNAALSNIALPSVLPLVRPSLASLHVGMPGVWRAA